MSESYNVGDAHSEMGSCTNLSTISDASSTISTSNTHSTTATSTSSKIAVSSGLPRPSGLKQPSKLSRICGGTQKPPVPLSPKSNGTNSTIRKISDDLAKKKLSSVEPSTVIEHRFSADRKGSVGSDSLWPSWVDHRRLSEAGVRRSSDSSIVLTEDTDSFIIGDRVWVGGNKPGQIAYIGETQFAPGDWAGIVLDQPIGKNDGSVGGVRYFQCEPKRGIFSRLTRLTRKPLFNANEGEVEKSRPTGASTSPRHSISSTRSSISSPTSPLSKVSSTNATNATAKSSDLKVGDRVIVMSSMGSKTGCLRYLGPTDFAPGEWCGVELDDPLGKNDGTVAGRWYFDALPNFGLFAPVHKVSKSPTWSRKPSTPLCAMHPTGSGYKKKSGSRESLNSTTTTATAASSIKSTSRRPSSLKTTPHSSTPSHKTPLQDLLQQKQQHIEQLLKERDLERAEVTRAASQAEQAEHDLAVMKQDFIQFKEETAAKNNDYDLLISQLQMEKQELSHLLDDERRRYEDLQFRYEEESITRADLEARLAKTEEKLKELENQDRLNQEALEIESNKLFEAEETLTKLKDEYEILRTKLIQVEKENNESNKILLEKAESKLSGKDAEFENKVKEFEEIKTQFKLLEGMNSELRQNNEELKKQNVINFEKYEKNSTIFTEEIKKLKLELDESESKRKELEENSIKLVNGINECKIVNDKLIEDNVQLTKDIKDLKEKSKEVDDCVKEKDTLIKELQVFRDNQLEEIKKKSTSENETFLTKEKQFSEELEHLQSVINKKEIENESIKKEKQEIENRLNEQQNILKSEFVSKCSEFEKEKSEYKIIINDLNMKLKENDEIKSKLNQRELSENELVAKVNSLELLLKNQKVDFESQNQILLDTLKSKDLELNAIRESLEKSKSDNQLLKEKLEKLSKANDELGNKLVSELEVSKLKDKENEIDKKKLTDDILLKQNFIDQLQKSIENNEKQIKQIGDDLLVSNKKINEFELKVGDLMTQLSNSVEKCSQLSAEKIKLQEDISTLMNNSTDSSSQLSKLNDELRAKENALDKLQETLNDQMRLAKNYEQQMKHQHDEVEQINGVKLQFENELKNKINEYEKLKSAYEIQKKSFNELSVKFENTEKDSEEKLKTLLEKNEEQKKLIAVLETDAQSNSKIFKELEEKVKKASKIENELRATTEVIEADSKNYKKEMDNLLNDKVVLEEIVKKLENNFKEKDMAVMELTASKDKIEEMFNNEKNVLEKKINQLNNEIKNSGEMIKKKDSEIVELSKENHSFKDENTLTKKYLEEKDQKLISISNDLDKIKGSLLSSEERYNEIKSKLTDDSSKLLKEKEEIQELFKGKEFELTNILREFEKLKDEKIYLEKVIKEKESLVDNESKQIEILTSDMIVMKNDLEKLNSDKVNLEEKLKLTSSEMNRLMENEKLINVSYQNELIKLKEENSVLVQKLHDFKEKLSSDQKVINQLDNAKQEASQVIKQLEQSELTQQQLKNEIKSFEEKLKETNQTNLSLQNTVDNYKTVLSDKEIVLLSLRNEVKMLQVERDQNVQNQKYAEMLKEEKKTLEEKVLRLQSKPLSSSNSNNNAIATSNLSSSAGSTTVTSGSTEKQNEDNEMLHGQINFLNSIIVDLQNKNDVLQTRIHHLETAEPDPTSLNGIKTRTVAPRLFCDICDLFDAHDTEDCPTQSNTSPVPEQKKPYPRGYERPYCENCEIFGHDTAECEDETF